MTRFFTTASLIAVLFSAAPASATLVNHWTFDNADTSGLVANDTAGSFANNATYREATGLGMSFGAAGQVGEAVSFTGDNGTDRVFDVLNGPGGSMEIAGTTTLSISMWINPETSQNSGATGIFTGRGSNINRGATSFTNQFWGAGWEEFNGDDRRLRGDSTGSTRSGALYDGSETESEWFHIVFTWEGDGVAGPVGNNDPTAVYVNGALDTAGTVNADLYNSGTWLIGGDPNSGADRNFGGLLDDLAVFDSVLTDQDVLAIYDGGLAGQNVAQVIPEPGSLALMGLGGLFVLRRRRK